MDELLFQSLIDLLIARSLAGKTEADCASASCKRVSPCSGSQAQPNTSTRRLVGRVLFGGGMMPWSTNHFLAAPRRKAGDTGPKSIRLSNREPFTPSAMAI